jgi:hypothetical protein
MDNSFGENFFLNYQQLVYSSHISPTLYHAMQRDPDQNLNLEKIFERLVTVPEFEESSLKLSI